MESQLSAVLSAVGCPCDWTLGNSVIAGFRLLESHSESQNKMHHHQSRQGLADNADDRTAEP